MNDIIPSTKLRMVSIHKLKQTSCWRRYFWSRVLNLESRKPNLNFWYGGVLHTGFETLLLTKNLKKALTAANNESKRRLSRYNLSGEDNEETNLQLRLIKVIITAAAKRPFVKEMKLDWAEKQFKCKLPNGLIFCSTADGGGIYKKRPSLYEIKTASSVYANYFTSLSFDRQVHGYAWNRKQNKCKPYSQCAYCIFRKPGKKLKTKRGQTPDGFVAEIEADLEARPEWYFIIHPLTLGVNTIENAGRSIIAHSNLLKQRYDVPKKTLLDPHYWPDDGGQCLNYGGCTFLPLCKNMARWKVYLRMYQQREMLYEEEKQELET